VKNANSNSEQVIKK